MSLRFIVFLLLNILAYSTVSAQFFNEEVEAQLNLQDSNEFIEVTGAVFNKTEISQSLRYVFSVIRAKDRDDTDRIKEDQEGRFVIGPQEKMNIAQTAIQSGDEERIIILLLIYDLDDKIIGKDRIVLNDQEGEETITVTAPDKNMVVEEAKDAQDGIVLKGIVVEDTKTRPGREFYNLFYNSYTANNINGEKIVTIREVLTIGNNTKIEVSVGDELVSGFIIRPQSDYLKAMTDASIRRVYLYFQKLEREKDIIKRY